MQFASFCQSAFVVSLGRDYLFDQPMGKVFEIVFEVLFGGAEITHLQGNILPASCLFDVSLMTFFPTHPHPYFFFQVPQHYP